MEGNITFKFGKKEVITLISLIVLAILGFAGISIFGTFKESGSKVVVLLDGQTLNEFYLNEDVKHTITTELGTNTLVIKDGKAYVTSADCPDEICVAHVPISKTDEEIICVPHRLVIVIK